MVSKIWNGSDDSFSVANDWSPTGIPGAGDTATIQSGTVTLANSILAGTAVNVISSGAGSAALQATNSTIASGSTVYIGASALDATLSVAGTLTNSGVVAFVSGSAGTSDLVLPGDTGPAVFLNQASLLIDGDASFSTRSSANATALTNNGTFTIENDVGATRPVFIQVGINGTGTVAINNGTTTDFTQGVGAGQTVAFGAGTATAEFDATSQLAATFAGLSTTSSIVLANISANGQSYQTTGPASGNLVLTQNGAAVETLAFSGDYAANSFDVSTATRNGLPFTTIPASGAAPQRVALTDTTTGVQSADPATYYTGPVASLQWQYIWGSTDNVNMAAEAANMFLHGGSGSDALSALSGSNVLDGGGGSNFLVGASGADGGADTFFVDGRGGAVTWSSIVNFHHGDSATIFGFAQGTSTLPALTIDGAAGYTGATIHSELNGAGTGVNGSITFAGISAADAQDVSQGGKFTYTYGTTGGASYVNVAYTG